MLVHGQALVRKSQLDVQVDCASCSLPWRFGVGRNQAMHRDDRLAKHTASYSCTQAASSPAHEGIALLLL